MKPVKKQKVEENEEEKEVEPVVEGSEKNSVPEDDDDNYDDDDDDKSEEKPHVPDVCFNSSDSEDYMHPEYEEYVKQIRESRGFYVPPRPKGLRISDNVVPTKNKKILRELSLEAIQFYNKNNGADYVFDSVVMGNMNPSCGILYYITFRASDAEGIREFEAIVLDAPTTINVRECTRKTKPGCKGEGEAHHP